MARILHDVMPAASGMDLTTDPTLLPDGMAQNLVNLLNDRAGLLRATLSLPSLVSAGSALDGLGFVPPCPATGSLIALPAGLLVASAGNYAFTPFHTPLTYPPTCPALTATTGGSYAAGHRNRFAPYNREMYGGYDQNVSANWRFVIGGSGSVAAYQMGIQPPLQSTVPLTPALHAVATTYKTGTVQYAITLTDSLGRESNLSVSSPPQSLNYGAQTIGAAGNDGIVSVNFAGADLQSVNWNLYATTNGGATYYRVNVNPIPIGTTSFEDNIPDSTLIASPLAPNPGENAPPQPASLLCVHQDRMVLDSTNQPGWIQISNLGAPTQFAQPTGIGVNGLPLATDGVQMQVSDASNPVMGLVSFGSTLMILCYRNIYMLYGQDATDYKVYPLWDNRGCIAKDSVVRCNDGVSFLSDDGVYLSSYSGGFALQKVSGPLEKTLNTLNATTSGRAQLEAATAAFFDNGYHLSVGTSIYRLDFGKGAWTSLFPGITPGLWAMVRMPGSVEMGMLVDNNSVVLLDTHTSGQSVSNITYQTRLLQTPQESVKGVRKRLKRTYVYGSGTISSGNVTATFDGKTEQYPITVQDSSEGYVGQQMWSAAVEGRNIDITLALTGTNIVLSSVENDYTVIG